MAAQTLVKNVHAVILIAVILATFREIDGLTVIGSPGASYELINDTTVVVTSPNYPNPYSNGQDLIWKFETLPDSGIFLIFDFFDVEYGQNCEFDYVLIYDGHTSDSPLLGKFCGKDIPPLVRSTGNKVFMRFHTDGGSVRNGFKVIFKRELGVRFISGVDETERNLTQYYVKTIRRRTRTIYKWGSHVARAAVALYLNNPQTFVPGNQNGEEMAYELSLQFLLKLSLKKRIPTNDLALYINALTIACVDPKNAFGVNLISELRRRVNNSNSTNPFYILTLCNAKDTMIIKDVHQLQQEFYNHFRPIWTDTEAMIVMALSCIASRSDISIEKSILDEMVFELKRKQHSNGTVDNLKTTTLVIQALLAAGKNFTDFDLNGAVTFILQEVNRAYPSLKDLYYILPIFNSMSLANIGSEHCEAVVGTDSEMMKSMREGEVQYIHIQVSIIFGNDMGFSRTWKLKVPSNYSFYEVLEIIGNLEPACKVQYSVLEGKPYVVALPKFKDDTQDGFFWFIYTKPLSSTENLRIIQESPVDIQVKNDEELILWYRSEFWTYQEDSSG